MAEESTEPLRTEQAVGDVVTAIEHDLKRAADLVRQANAIVRYVEKNTSRWLDKTPGLLLAKSGELDLVVQVLEDEGKAIKQRITSEGRLPPVEVITGGKAKAS